MKAHEKGSIALVEAMQQLWEGLKGLAGDGWPESFSI